MSAIAAANGVGGSTLRSVLDGAISQLELDLDETQRQKLLKYIELLSRWNRTYNLTAIRDPHEMLVQHVIDCLALISPLRFETVATAGRRVLDVGSGAGLPGVVVAIAASEFDVVCVDSVGKKTAFVSHVAQQLELANVRVQHERVEKLSGRFDVITSRAFSSLPSFLESTRHLLDPTGVWLAMKAKRPTRELEESASPELLFHVEQLHVPGLIAERCLVSVRLAPIASAN